MSKRRDFTDTTDRRQRDPQFAVGIERAFSVLRAFTGDDVDLTNAELMERTGLPKPTVSRMTNTLTHLGYLSYSQRTGTYALGAGLIALSAPMMSALNIRERARPHMRALAERSGASVAIAAPAGVVMTYVEHVPGSGALVLRFSLGSQMPMERTAMGRAHLAALDDATLEKALADLRRYGVLEPGIEEGIAAAREDVERFGFCVSLGQWRKGIHAVATPLLIPGHHTPLVLNCGAPADLLPEPTMRDDIGPALLEIAGTLGAQPVARHPPAAV